MQKSVLLIGKKDDPHITGIINELKKLGEKTILIDDFSFLDSFSVMLDNDGKSDSIVKTKEIAFMNDEIKSVWNSTALRLVATEKILTESRKFVEAEWTEGISSIWNTFEAKWINHPLSINSSINRVKQLQIASNCGLKIPKTLVTNDPQQLLGFYEKTHENMIAKTLHSSEGLPEGKMIFTTKITKEDLQNANEIRYAPSMFQEYIPKKTELRISIIGSKIHAVEIHSQNSEKTMYDWRHYDDFDKTPYIPVELSETTSEKLLKIMQRMGLNFGAVDMIKTPDNELVFLEINSNGRWWWIQELTGVNIAKDIAIFLAET
jgi:glutathione synthase/RimK-type ligase-like ATP-grasp enzyme